MLPNRILKESINESVGLSGCSPFAQDLFKRLITYADDYGRFNGNLDIMRARLYPLETEAVEATDLEDAFVELVATGKVGFYRAKADIYDDLKIFGQMTGWGHHQRVRNSRKKFPEPEEMVNDWALRRAIGVDLKRALFERDAFTCQQCHHSFALPGLSVARSVRLLSGVLHVDHVVPVQEGGRATLENLRLLCASCHRSRRRAVSFEDMRALAASRGNSPQVAAGSYETLPESESGSESNPNPTVTHVTVRPIRGAQAGNTTEDGSDAPSGAPPNGGHSLIDLLKHVQEQLTEPQAKPAKITGQAFTTVFGVKANYGLIAGLLRDYDAPFEIVRLMVQIAPRWNGSDDPHRYLAAALRDKRQRNGRSEPQYLDDAAAEERRARNATWEREYGVAR